MVVLQLTNVLPLNCCSTPEMNVYLVECTKNRLDYHKALQYFLKFYRALTHSMCYTQRSNYDVAHALSRVITT